MRLLAVKLLQVASIRGLGLPDHTPHQAATAEDDQRREWRQRGLHIGALQMREQG